MRLWTFSDLHLDARGNTPDPLPRAPASFDAVVVAGDLSSPLTAALDWLHERLPGVPVVYVAGNHDAWCGPDADDRYTLEDQIQRGRELAARHGITLLENDAAVIGGVRFLGATLWSDLGLTARLTTMDPARVVGRGMLDYRRIRRRRSGRHHYVGPSDLLARHHASRAWLETELARPHDGPTVVVTHHAPHPMSLPDAYDLLAGAYASDLSATILRHGPDLWVHGHVHGRADYHLGQTRVVCNARGHWDETSAVVFDPALVVEV